VRGSAPAADGVGGGSVVGEAPEVEKKLSLLSHRGTHLLLLHGTVPVRLKLLLSFVGLTHVSAPIILLRLSARLCLIFFKNRMKIHGL
jgi:hypothetical protein